MKRTTETIPRPIEVVVRRVVNARFRACMCRVAPRGRRDAAARINTLSTMLARQVKQNFTFTEPGGRLGREPPAASRQNWDRSRLQGMLRGYIDRRPAGMRADRDALGKHKSFVSQLTNPIDPMPIPARHLSTIPTSATSRRGAEELPQSPMHGPIRRAFRMPSRRRPAARSCPWRSRCCAIRESSAVETLVRQFVARVGELLD